MAEVNLANISKLYDRSHPPAVDDVSFTVEHGEFFTLLGPSGCGKSTTLRMIAGLESITSGTLSIDNRVVNAVPAKDRDIAMVFQSYALYPHMTASDNLAFGLRRRAIPRDEIDRRVKTAAAMLGLTDFLHRKPHSLSGGQRQRVALGRAIVRNPKLFLFDEPLSNLDAALRVSTRNEIVNLHRRLGATMIYVTHDQVEAMTMSHRICIMNGGRVVQVGRPLDIYRSPANTFVAQFLGSPPMNVVPTHASVDGDLMTLRLGDWTISLPGWTAAELVGRDILFGIRPENLYEPHAVRPGSATVPLPARVRSVEPLGAETLLRLEIGGSCELTARVDGESRAAIDDRFEIAVDAGAVTVFDAATTSSIPRRCDS